MTIYIEGEIEPIFVKDLNHLADLVKKEDEITLGSCIVCGEICNSKQSKYNEYVCSPDCLGG
ncbi:MAG: hypothetical protein ACPGVD_09015 [Flavobacteriales bacterium]